MSANDTHEVKKNTNGPIYDAQDLNNSFRYDISTVNTEHCHDC